MELSEKICGLKLVQIEPRSIDSSEKRIILDYQLTVLLADRTNGRAYATVLRLSSVVVCPSSSVVCDVMYCGQTVRPRAKDTIESP